MRLDEAGSDSYRPGCLRDRRGNDRFWAGRYAQMAGIHTAIGVLIDERCDDSYDVSSASRKGSNTTSVSA